MRPDELASTHLVTIIGGPWDGRTYALRGHVVAVEAPGLDGAIVRMEIEQVGDSFVARWPVDVEGA